jgi:peptidoglycan-associated lipoprotein
MLTLIAACETGPGDGGAATGSGIEGGTGGNVTETSSVTAESISDVEKSSLPPAEALVEVGDSVYFQYDRFDLTSEARATLDKQAALLLKHPSMKVNVEGHCDERGTREYNLALSARRANSVKDYLVALGVSPARISTTPYGEERPSVLGSNESAWAKNRRAVTVPTSAAAGS